MRKKQQLPKQMNAPIYGYWQALYMAFYSSRLYVDVVKRWRGVGLLYLLLLISFAAIPVSIRVIIDFNQYFNEKLIVPIKQIPPLYINHGKIEVDKVMPYLIKDKTGAVVALIDTRGNVSGMDSSYPNLAIVITNDTLYFKSPKFHLFLNGLTPVGGEKIMVEKMDEDMSEVFVPEVWLKSSEVLRLKWITDMMIYPLIVSFFFGLYLTILLVITMLAQTVSWLIFKCQLNFKEAARMLMVSSSAQVILLLFLLAANALFSGVGLLCVALGAAYFSYGVLAFRRENKSVARA